MNISTQLNASKANLLKTIPFFILTLFFASSILAQPPGKGNKQAHHEKIEKMKIGFITNELDLSSEEAEKFWPIYNEMSDKLRAEKKERREISKELKANFKTYSEDDFKEKSAAIFNSESKEIEIKREYTAKIADVISYKKAVKLLSLEQRFKRELLNKINRAERPNKPERPEKPKRPE